MALLVCRCDAQCPFLHQQGEPGSRWASPAEKPSRIIPAPLHRGAIQNMTEHRQNCVATLVVHPPRLNLRECVFQHIHQRCQRATQQYRQHLPQEALCEHRSIAKRPARPTRLERSVDLVGIAIGAQPKDESNQKMQPTGKRVGELHNHSADCVFPHAATILTKVV